MLRPNNRFALPAKAGTHFSATGMLVRGSRLAPGMRLGEPPGRSGSSAADAGDELGQGHDADAVAEIAKPFIRPAGSGEQRKQRVEGIGDAGDVEPLGERGVEPRALEIAADVKRVETRDAADNADIAGIGAGAAVR